MRSGETFEGPGLGRRLGSQPYAASTAPTAGVSIQADALSTRAFLAFADVLKRYHRHRVLHLERLASLFEDGRRVIVVGNHVLDIDDPLLFLAAVFRRLGRVPNFIGHENGWFKVPLLREIARRYQVIPSRRPEQTLAALRRNGFLMLFPGANREAALRSYHDEPYRLKWQNRHGFLRLALEADAEIVFVAAIGNDEAYYQSRLPTPRALLAMINAGDADRYESARLQFGLFGAHLVPGIFPFPVRLTHVVSPPLDLGDRERALRDPRAMEVLHQQAWQECQKFLDRAVANRDQHTDLLDRGVRGLQSLLHRLGA